MLGSFGGMSVIMVLTVARDQCTVDDAMQVPMVLVYIWQIDGTASQREKCCGMG